MKLEPLKLQPLVEDEATDVLPAALPKPSARQPSRRQSPPHRRRRRGRLWIVVLLIILLAGVAAGGALYLRGKNQSQVQYLQAAVTTGNLSVKVSATGPIAPGAEYDMNFPVSGQVSAISVQVGQKVTKGQVLAELTIDKTTLQNSITQDEQAVKTAQSNLAAAQQNLSNAKSGQTNANSVTNAGLTVAGDAEQKAINDCVQAASTPIAAPNPVPNPSATSTPTSIITTINSQATATAASATEAQCEQAAQDQYAQAQAQADQSTASSKNSVTTSQQQVTSAQNSLNNAYLQLQAAVQALNSASTNAILTAPANATVAAINGVPGQTVGAGPSGSASTSSSSSNSSSSQALIILTDLNTLTITAQVNEVDIGNVQEGQSSQFTVAAYPTQTFRATVSAINTIGQTTSNVVSYTVLLTVDQQSLNGTHLYPGMTATVNITTAERIGVLLVPAAALSFPSTAVQAGEVSRRALFTSSNAGQGTATGQGTQHIVLELKSGSLTPVTITTGLTDGQNTEVLSGLNDGDEVVIGQVGGNIPSSSSAGNGSRLGGGFGGGFGGGGFGGGGGGGRSKGTP